MSFHEFFDDVTFDPLALALVRNVSDDNLFSVLYNSKPDQPETVTPAQYQPCQASTLQHHHNVPNFIEYQRQRTDKTAKCKNDRRDYKKNICGYITKKIVRQFISQAYKQKVERLCEKHCCDYEEVVDYYNKKIESITGPTHLDMLLNVSKGNHLLKKCFKEFFIWFLRHRYLRYLLSEGKMQKKQEYVDYKNRTLLYLGSLDEDMDLNNSSYGQNQSPETVFINDNTH